MRKYFSSSFIFLLLICGISFGCSSTPELENIDLQAWKNGEGGCNKERLKEIDKLLNQKEKLYGLSQADIVTLLGKADKHQLYERSQKFFIYYLEPSASCTNKHENDYIKALYIRFSALDSVNELIIQKVKP